MFIVHDISINPLCPLCTAEQSELEKVEVEYITMPGWKTSITRCKKVEDLPPNARAYINKIQELIGVPGKGWIMQVKSRNAG